jgi:hypothetical protein
MDNLTNHNKKILLYYLKNTKNKNKNSKLRKEFVLFENKLNYSCSQCGKLTLGFDRVVGSSR